MAKKTFNLNNPAMQFISTPTEEPIKPEEIAPAPEGYKISPLYVEKKTKRLQLLLKPSVFDKLKAKALKEDRSVNDIINTYLEEILKGE